MTVSPCRTTWTAGRAAAGVSTPATFVVMSVSDPVAAPATGVTGAGRDGDAGADGVSTDLWADGSYSVNTGDYIYHYDAFGNMIGVQVYNGAWYETIWG